MKTLKYSKFTSIEDIKDKLSELLKCKVAEIGYIEPGHGLKGKQQTLIDDDDIDEMYRLRGINHPRNGTVIVSVR